MDTIKTLSSMAGQSKVPDTTEGSLAYVWALTAKCHSVDSAVLAYSGTGESADNTSGYRQIPRSPSVTTDAYPISSHA